MKKITTIIAILFSYTFLLAQTTSKADRMHSKLTFSTVHQGISDIDRLFKTFEITAIAKKNRFQRCIL